MSQKIKTINLPASTWIVISLFAFTTAYTQDTTYKIAKPVFIQASLLYDFPESYGITAGVSYPLNSVVKKRISKNGKQLMKQKDLLWGVDAGVYRYPYNYTGVLFVPFMGVRHYVNPSFFYETSLGMGVLRTFYDGKVYEVDAAGNVKEKSLFGRYYATTHLSSAFDFLLQKPDHPNLALQVKPTLWLQYPFNSFIKPHVSLEAGIKYEIGTRAITMRKTTKYLRK